MADRLRDIQLSPASRAVAANLMRLRKAQRLTTTRLSAALDELGQPIHASGITRIEKGERRVDVDDLVALAKALNVRPEQLLMPFECHVCHGQPPAGFACRTCGAEASGGSG